MVEAGRDHLQILHGLRVELIVEVVVPVVAQMEQILEVPVLLLLDIQTHLQTLQ